MGWETLQDGQHGWWGRRYSRRIKDATLGCCCCFNGFIARCRGRAWQALMKEIDGLIACSHYGVIEWLCTYDQTVDADVARK